MLKKICVTAGIGLALSAGVVLADDNGPGCGLGKMIWGSSTNKIIQGSLAATTNATAGQTYSITTGTSGCTNHGIVQNDKQVEVFVAVNFENLKEDMVRGQGEYLQSLSNLMGVPAEKQPTFFAMAQEHYQDLFPSSEAGASHLLSTLESIRPL